MNNTADARIQRWKRWWDVDDPYVRCTQCGAQQMIEDAGQPFNPLHSIGCPLRSDLPQYPWLSLRALLQEWQQETSDKAGPR
ncbi:hypothetical protein HBH25_22280 [Pseudomonas sp. hsmgli-8]|uniref:Uncharacterized protein n=1 Tax=Pseudomonas quercus TaxID=2722792 RepID=A0ABX0YN09_9PSED|nr:hypothetical protein [Pseudomonas quercus]NJP03559.1 hypothetical protein [Pseudomonas quercus]